MLYFHITRLSLFSIQYNQEEKKEFTSTTFDLIVHCLVLTIKPERQLFTDFICSVLFVCFLVYELKYTANMSISERSETCPPLQLSRASSEVKKRGVSSGLWSMFSFFFLHFLSHHVYMHGDISLFFLKCQYCVKCKHGGWSGPHVERSIEVFSRLTLILILI